MKKFLNWLVLSSEDPKEISLTIRGIAVSFLPLIVSFLNDLGVGNLEGQVLSFIVATTAVLGILLTVVGIVRKIYNTYGSKEVVIFTKTKKLSTTTAKKSKAKAVKK